MKRIIGYIRAGAIVLAPVGLAVNAAATPAPKVKVCKYVSTPGNEVAGPTIEVSANAIDNPSNPGWDANNSGVVDAGDLFSDAQGQSVVVSSDRSTCGTTETSPPPTPTCEELENCETPTPTPTVTPEPTTPPVVSCPGSVRLSRFFSDPLININLRDEGTFVISGGLIRRTGAHVITRTLTCGQVIRIKRYHVYHGETVTVTLNGTVVAQKTANKGDYR